MTVQQLAAERVGGGKDVVFGVTDHTMEDKLTLLGSMPWGGTFTPSQLIESKETSEPFGFSALPTQIYSVPDLTAKSALYGLSRYIHEQRTISSLEMQTLLQWMQIEFGPYLATEMWTKSEAIGALDFKKASGLPWCTICGTQKGDAIHYAALKLGITAQDVGDSQLEAIYDFFEQDFKTFTPIFKLTLKDEIRLKKPARSFLPAPLQSILVGNRLFGAQNELLARFAMVHPMTIGLQIPGRSIINLFDNLGKFSVNCADADGSAFDANFPLWAAELILNLRCKYLPEEYHELARRYYETTYNGMVACAGFVYHLIGNRSGHTNTSVDNSFLECAGFMLKAIRAGLDYSEFKKLLLYYVNGDDVVWSSKSPLFSPRSMVSHMESLGVYWECGSAEFCKVTEVTFIGMQRVNRLFRDHEYSLYSFRRDKILNSSKYWLKGSASIDKIAKIVSLVILTFGDAELFERCREEALNFVMRLIQADSNLRVKAAGLLFFLLDDVPIFNLYTRAEVRPSIDLVSLAFADTMLASEASHSQVGDF